MDLQELTQAVRRLEDIQAIQTLKYRYLRCADTGDIEGFRKLMHPDVIIDFVGGSYEIKLEGAEAFIRFMRQTMHGGIVGQHSGHHPDITILSDTEATGIWYLFDMFVDNVNLVRMYGSLLYEDGYEKVDGTWLIRSTRYRRVYEVVDKLDKPLNLTAHLLGEVGARRAAEDPGEQTASLFKGPT